jgi:hypothetical protein
MVCQFLRAAGVKQGSLLEPPNQQRVNFCIGHVDEEWTRETLPALRKFQANPTLENLVEVADGLADTIYVVCQLADSLGVPLNGVFAAVAQTNFPGKLFPDGKLHRNPETGKILKPAGWAPPDIFEILKAHADWEAIQRNKLGAENWTGTAWSNTKEAMEKHSGK